MIQAGKQVRKQGNVLERLSLFKRERGDRRRTAVPVRVFSGINLAELHLLRLQLAVQGGLSVAVAT